MSAENRSLTEDEIKLRVTTPLFFEDLIGSRTETIIEAKNPEAFAAWKEIREQANREFATLSADALLEVAREQQAKPFDVQCKDLAATLSRFAASLDIPLERLGAPEQTAASCARILREEREFEFAAEHSPDQIPPLDMRLVAGREIDESRAAYREQTEPAQNQFREMSQSARDEFLAEQRQIGRDALKSQSQSIQQTQTQSIDPPEHDH